MAKAKKTPTRREVLATTATAGVLALELSEIFSATAQKTDTITLPVAVTTFPDEDLFRAPESWARRAFPNLIHFRDAERDFPAWEAPELFTSELRDAFKPLRRSL